jgi:hypothetical protein
MHKPRKLVFILTLKEYVPNQYINPKISCNLLLELSRKLLVNKSIECYILIRSLFW